MGHIWDILLLTILSGVSLQPFSYWFQAMRVKGVDSPPKDLEAAAVTKGL
jgi:hypothetical protein